MRLEAVIAARGASTKYEAKVVNTDLYVLFFLINFEEFQTNLFYVLV